MWNKGFKGWYFKHQRGADTIALIPGQAESGAFVQLLCPEGARQFPVESLAVRGGVIHADSCRFSLRGCRIDLPGVGGVLHYGRITPLASDIMGPFAHLPMQCRHGVLSMGHTLCGSLTVDGVPHCFDQGRGYIEMDSGTSFPRFYLWLHCNDFPIPLSVMLSIAHIPFGGAAFTGCICAILLGGREYRLATYRGVRIQAPGPQVIRLSQGGLLLELEVQPTQVGHPLAAPVRGQMSGTIRESVNAALHLRLWERGRLVCDQYSPHATYEFVPEPPGQSRGLAVESNGLL